MRFIFLGVFCTALRLIQKDENCNEILKFSFRREISALWSSMSLTSTQQSLRMFGKCRINLFAYFAAFDQKEKFKLILPYISINNGLRMISHTVERRTLHAKLFYNMAKSLAYPDYKFDFNGDDWDPEINLLFNCLVYDQQCASVNTNTLVSINSTLKNASINIKNESLAHLAVIWAIKFKINIFRHIQFPNPISSNILNIIGNLVKNEEETALEILFENVDNFLLCKWRVPKMSTKQRIHCNALKTLKLSRKPRSINSAIRNFAFHPKIQVDTFFSTNISDCMYAKSIDYKVLMFGRIGRDDFQSCEECQYFGQKGAFNRSFVGIDQDPCLILGKCPDSTINAVNEVSVVQSLNITVFFISGSAFLFSLLFIFYLSTQGAANGSK